MPAHLLVVKVTCSHSGRTLPWFQRMSNGRVRNVLIIFIYFTLTGLLWKHGGVRQRSDSTCICTQMWCPPVVYIERENMPWAEAVEQISRQTILSRRPMEYDRGTATIHLGKDKHIKEWKSMALWEQRICIQPVDYSGIISPLVCMKCYITVFHISFAHWKLVNHVL